MKHKLFLLAFLSVFLLKAQEYNVKDHYNKQEVAIKMRDGVHLHTTIYSPKDTSKEYPIVMQRTPIVARHTVLINSKKVLVQMRI